MSFSKIPNLKRKTLSNNFKNTLGFYLIHGGIGPGSTSSSFSSDLEILFSLIFCFWFIELISLIVSVLLIWIDELLLFIFSVDSIIFLSSELEVIDVFVLGLLIGLVGVAAGLGVGSGLGSIVLIHSGSSGFSSQKHSGSSGFSSQKSGSGTMQSGSLGYS